ncbi:glycosyltransferase family 2 protein [Anaerorhabdus furcosa]|uniref:Glycosyl transferase family 2 n=1 Tax=Anaerorhabdus furcosa TaxID=118967 RepID=A0A1T4NYY0_9FIRM|nr:glycosyltransferase family 2 protein [Anaerorhabdus furcosa]SJZ84421.1 Glycosyl transferase family 2 [Anaerorhabdus furcosa]
MDKIEILLATFNGDKYLEEQLLSLINQSYSDITITISDDGSTDCTLDIIEKYMKLYPNMIKLLPKNNNHSSCKNFLYLLENSVEKYCMFSDQDDVWDKNKVMKSYHKMKEYEANKQGNPILIFTDLTVVDKNLNVISNSFMKFQGLCSKNVSFNKLLLKNVVTGCTIMMNNYLKEKVIKSKNHWDKVIIHDWWVALIASKFGEIGFIDESTILYRQHETNAIGAKKRKTTLSNILSSVICFDLKKEMKYYRDLLDSIKNQAGLFCNIYEDDLNQSDNQLLVKFSQLDNSNIIAKINFLIRNHFYTNYFLESVVIIILL